MKIIATHDTYLKKFTCNTTPEDIEKGTEIHKVLKRKEYTLNSFNHTKDERSCEARDISAHAFARRKPP